MEPIYTENAPQPAGHYSQAVVHNDLIFVSGLLPIDPVTSQPVFGTMEEQAALALQNLRAVLQAAGSDLDRVLKTTVYISDISWWGQVNQVYAAFFGEHRPARAVVPVKELHFGLLIEIEAVAYR